MLEYPGENPFAGTYRGREAFVTHLHEVSERSGGTHRVSLLGMEREPDGLLVRLDVSVGKGAHAVRTTEIAHVQFHRGLVTRVLVEFPEQARWDAFWRPRA